MPLGFLRRPAMLVAALAASVCAAAPVPASEVPRFEVIWTGARAPGSQAGHPLPGLLSLPEGWMAGDAAVIFLDESWPETAREKLREALLGEGAAVLEFDPETARKPGTRDAQAGPRRPTAADLASDLRGAVETLQRDAAAGLVVALGRGAGGAAALLAATAARGEPGGDGLAAAASMGPGPAAFALGGVPAEGEMGVHRGWPVRAKRLCRVLATAAAPPEIRAEADCRRALVEPREARPVRFAGP